MICAKVRILTEIQDDGSEIRIAVSDDGQSVMISGKAARMRIYKDDLQEVISALMAADAYMDRIEVSGEKYDASIRAIFNLARD